MGAAGSVNKVFWSDLDIALHETALDLLGPAGRARLAVAGRLRLLPLRADLRRHQRDPAQHRGRAGARLAEREAAGLVRRRPTCTCTLPRPTCTWPPNRGKPIRSACRGSRRGPADEVRADRRAARLRGLAGQAARGSTRRQSLVRGPMVTPQPGLELSPGSPSRGVTALARPRARRGASARPPWRWSWPSRPLGRYAVPGPWVETFFAIALVEHTPTLGVRDEGSPAVARGEASWSRWRCRRTRRTPSTRTSAARCCSTTAAFHLVTIGDRSAFGRPGPAPVRGDSVQRPLSRRPPGGRRRGVRHWPPSRPRPSCSASGSTCSTSPSPTSSSVGSSAARSGPTR